MDQVSAEWAERIEMDSAIPEKRDKSGLAALASKAFKKSATGH